MRSYKTILFILILFATAWFSDIKAQESVQYYAIDQVEQAAKKSRKKRFLSRFLRSGATDFGSWNEKH